MYQVRRRLSFLLIALALGFSALAQAAVLEGFYRVEIPAREGLDRSQAMREAFELMIARQAGSEAVDSEAVLAAMQDPQQFMRRIAGTEAGGLRVEFEPASLRNLLTEASLPMLGPNRPSVMLWALDSGGINVELLGQGSDWAVALKDAAEYRAVALSLPLADLEDRTLVDIDTIRKADGPTLKRASERYDASAVLALTIEDTSEGSVLEWNWWLNEQAENGRITAESKAAAADQLMLEVADLVLDQYAVSPTNTSDVSNWEVVVQGIDNLDEFAALQRTLQQVGSKQTPSVLSIKGDQVRLALDFPGTEEQLERLLILDQRMRRMSAPKPEPEPGPELTPGSLPGDADLSPVDSNNSVDDSVTVVDDALTMESGDQSAELELEPDVELPELEPAANVMFFRWR